jgi:predicted DNA-binding protein (MmcQ/YjbR family)
MKNAQAKIDAALREIRAFGLAYPGTHLKSPWPDHCDLAVKDKTFAYLSIEGQPFGISCKLPTSGAVALLLPNARPTEYGLGKSGWVTVDFASGELPPLPLIKSWIDESYRAQAPKKLVATLASGVQAAPPAKKSVAKKSVAKKKSVEQKTPGKKKPSKKKTGTRKVEAPVTRQRS